MSEQPITLSAPLRLSWISGRALRQLLQTIHLWTGIVLALPMIVIGLSGSALIVQQQLVGLSVPAASADGEVRALADIVQAARTAMPPEIRPNWIVLPASSNSPAAVRFDIARRPTQTVEVYVDPVSLDVLGKSGVLGRGPIERFLIQIHGFLMMPSAIGLQTVGWLGIVMTFMCVSGLILWWPRPGRWLRAMTVARRARGLKLQIDLHKVVGFWGLIVFFILCISGVYLAFPRSSSDLARMLFPTGGDIAGIQSDLKVAWPLDKNEAILTATSAIPGARVTEVQLPQGERDRFILRMAQNGFGPAFPLITVGFDPATDEVISVDDPRNYSRSSRVLNTLYALHFNVGTGWVWSLLIFLAGLMPLFLAVTGTTIWWMKRRNRLALSR